MMADDGPRLPFSMKSKDPFIGIAALTPNHDEFTIDTYCGEEQQDSEAAEEGHHDDHQLDAPPASSDPCFLV